MKAWKIEEQRPGIYFLLHHHGERHEKYREYICVRSENGDWYCLICFEKAPDEIAFVADLANCDEVASLIRHIPPIECEYDPTRLE